MSDAEQTSKPTEATVPDPATTPEPAPEAPQAPASEAATSEAPAPEATTEESTPELIPAIEVAPTPKGEAKYGWWWGLGRRKSSVARVRIRRAGRDASGLENIPLGLPAGGHPHFTAAYRLNLFQRLADFANPLLHVCSTRV